MSTQTDSTSVRQTPAVSGGSETGQPLFEVQHTQVNLPYPPPQILAEYNQTIEGLGTKLTELIDRENQHRHHCELLSLQSDIDRHKGIASNERLALWAEFIPRLLGQVFAFSLCAGFGLGGFWLIDHGKEWPGAFFGTGGLVGLAWVFVRGGSAKPASGQPAPAENKTAQTPKQ